MFQNNLKKGDNRSILISSQISWADFYFGDTIIDQSLLNFDSKEEQFDFEVLD